MSVRARARLQAMRAGPTQKRLAASAASLRSSIRRQNLLQRRRAGRMRRANRITAGYLGIELKYFDTYKAPANLSATFTSGLFDPDNPSVGGSACDCMSAPAQGDGPTNRDGKKIKIKSVYIKGLVYNQSSTAQAAPDGQDMAYIALVLDRQTNGASAASNLVFSNPTGSSLNNINPLRNLEYADRFRILKDMVIDMTPPTLTAYGANTYSSTGKLKHFEWFVPLDLDVLFVNTNPTKALVSEVVNNSLHFYAFSTSATGSDVIACTYQARIRFVG